VSFDVGYRCSKLPITADLAMLLASRRSRCVISSRPVRPTLRWMGARVRADVVTGDRGDIRRLVEAAGVSCRVIDV
jgi:hypothetical protein